MTKFLKSPVFWVTVLAFVLAVLTTPILVGHFEKIDPQVLSSSFRIPLFIFNLGMIAFLGVIFLSLEGFLRNRNWVNHFFNMIFDLLGEKTIFIAFIFLALSYWVSLKVITTSPKVSSYIVSFLM